MDTSFAPHLSGVVVGVDGSESADHAATIAAEIASEEHRTLSLVHIIAPLEVYYWTRLPSNLAGYEAPMRKAAALELTALAGRLREKHPDLDIDSHIVLGDARDILNALSEHAHLMVVGTRGRGLLGGSHVGSVAVHLTRHAHSPVLVVRPGSRSPETGRVIAGIDDTERSQSVLDFAFEAAARTGGHLTIVHSDWLFAPGLADDGYTAPTAEDEDEVRRLVAEAAAGRQEKYPDVPVDVVVGHLAPDVDLVDRAKSNDLIVVGTRSHGAVGEFFLQSVATRVVEQAACAVAVVPSRPH